MNDRRPRREMTISALESLDSRVVPAAFGVHSSPVFAQHALALAEIGTVHAPLPLGSLPTVAYIGAAPTPGHFVFMR